MEYQGGGYSTTSYGAQGGAGGGGFMSGSQGGSQTTPGRPTYGKETLRPVTIKQVLEARQPHEEGEFSIDDVEIMQVTFIGQIRNISTQATNITYKLDDGTGTIEVKQWIDVDASSDNSTKNQKPKLVENDYARVWGRLKAFNNKRHVGAHVIRPITDKMEITHHLLEATYVHLYFTRGPLDQASKSNEANVQDQAGGYGMNTSSTMMGNGRQMPNVSLGAKRVYETLANTPQNNEGLHVQNIAASVQMSVQDVMKAGDELLSHSMIYTTVDDNTWALLEF